MALRRLPAVALLLLGLLPAILLPERTGGVLPPGAVVAGSVPVAVAGGEHEGWGLAGGAALSAWLPEWGSVASLTPRKTRSGAPTLLDRIEAGWGALWLAALGAALNLRSPLLSAVGLRWARSLRGPPALIPSA
jgi:hypothetical protein